uniref:single-stranded DNA cytosine deaminase n=1 Tax=Prolemur simus TaxID=1328070 RepID=A0A8C8YRH4_PROSS
MLWAQIWAGERVVGRGLPLPGQWVSALLSEPCLAHLPGSDRSHCPVPLQSLGPAAQRGLLHHNTPFSPPPLQVLLNSVCHTEELFLSWFHGMLSSDQDYQVTWYASWSPCAHCAGLVADFLATHTNVSLIIFAARLYYSWDPDYRQGLRRMNKEGAKVLIMNYKEFQYCWDNFVFNYGRPWLPCWGRLDENYQFLVTELEEILRDPMVRMYQKTFYYHFNNRPILSYRNDTWLCFEVETNKDSNSPVPLCSGVFRNQGDSKTPCHAEDCFLTWFQDMLSSDQDYQVTWYTSWSPCPECAGLVADFLATHTNVSLTIFAARLYYGQDPDYQQGLRRLNKEGAKVVRIMYYEEFEHCWAKFVYNHGKPWVANNNKLKKNYQFLVTKLEEILR